MGGPPSAIDVADLLEVAIAKTPIPTAPLAIGRGAESFGLHLLAAALRMPHVTRFTETLSLVDATHMARRVSVDMNISNLPRTAREALSRAGTNGHGGGVWVPLERHSRGALAPVLVRDDAGTVVPRLTGLETSHALGAGLARLFRIMMDGHPDALEDDTEVHQANTTNLRSRWLCEAAILALVERGTSSFLGTSVRIEPSTRSTDAAAIRTLAIRVCRTIASPGSPFHELVRIAASQYFLVARIPQGINEVYFDYDAPLLPAKTHTRVGGFISVSWLPLLSSEFTLQYDLVVPRGVDSYHLNLEVPEDIVIRRFALTSDGDGPIVERLVEDIRASAQFLRQKTGTPDKLDEAELQGIASRLAELGRRRAADLRGYRNYLQERFTNLQGPGPWLRPWAVNGGAGGRSVNSRTAFNYLVGAERLVESLDVFADAYENGHLNKLADSAEPSVLDELAGRLEKMELRYDVITDNDPRENAVHSQWRRRSFGRTRPFVGPVRLRVAASLADDAPSLSGSVMRLLIALGALVLTLAALLYEWPLHLPWGLEPSSRVSPNAGDGFSSTDALVTVLLLIPGLLLTRLDFPSHLTVLGRLRLLPRYLAYAGVGTTYALAVAVAALPAAASRGWFVAASWLLVVLIGISSVEGLVRSWRRRTLSLRTKSVPRWLRDEVRRLPMLLHRHATARFSTVPSDFNG